MNEVKKTGLFWAAAGVAAAIAAVVAWPTASRDEGGVSAQVNQDLFGKFKDPLTAASMKIVTFDEEQGKLAMFEVRKDRESELWTIPSRDGYPADAVEQMKDAANSLVGLKILDVQTENAEDHDDLGVVEPKLEDLEVGDTGVGRLVTLKDESQTTLASLIIGDPVKDREGQRYVRRPGQDPVYVVSLDDAPLTTQFNAWIEDDLLQLTSIDIEDVQIKDYSASLGLGGFSLSRNYTAELSMDGSQWELGKLLEFDAENPRADPSPVAMKPDESLNTTKLNDLKNALDDLKIVDVVRKPKGMSENLRADKELVSDNAAVASLAERGFYPANMGGNEVEILSANGELLVGLKDGVQYLMRFGNVAGLEEESDDSDGDKDDGDESELSGGVNRYLLVTTQVDESKFPPPDLKPVPQTIEELEELLAPEPEPPAEEPNESEPKAANDSETESKSDDSAASDDDDGDEKMKSDESSEAKEETVEEASEAKESDKKEAAEKSDAKDDGADAEESGETDTEGSGKAEVSGGAQEAGDDEADDGAADDDKEEANKTDDESTDKNPGDENDPKSESEANPEKTKESVDKAEQSEDDEKGKKDDASPSPPESESSSSDDPDDATDKSEPMNELADLTDEEKQERLEAEQEKITKENQRKLDERKDRIDAAKKRVSELNARFADWYYVIPEDTYSKLHIQRSELIEKKEEVTPPAGPPPGGFPQGGGLPAGFGN